MKRLLALGALMMGCGGGSELSEELELASMEQEARLSASAELAGVAHGARGATFCDYKLYPTLPVAQAPAFIAVLLRPDRVQGLQRHRHQGLQAAAVHAPRGAHRAVRAAGGGPPRLPRGARGTGASPPSGRTRPLVSAGENHENSPSDCPPACGNGLPDAGESSVNCPGDVRDI